MAGDPSPHERAVDAWLDGLPDGLPMEDVVDLFRQACGAIWRRAELRVGEVTLLAIGDRVLHDARNHFPDKPACIDVAASGFQLDALCDAKHKFDAAGCRGVLRFVLIDFLRILGRLTAEVLTSSLHAELRTVAPRRTAS
jgi:hypothetical protein